MRLQKGLLAGVWVGPVKGRAPGHAPHAEQVDLLPFAIHLGPRLVPIHLALLSPPIALRKEYLGPRQTHFLSAHSHLTPHRRLRNVDLGMLAFQPTPDPMRRVRCLRGAFRSTFASGRCTGSPAPASAGPAPEPSAPAERHCRLLPPHHSPVDTEVPGHPLDRPYAVLILSAHLLEEFHLPVPPVQPDSFPGSSPETEYPVSVSNRRAKSEDRGAPIQSSEITQRIRSSLCDKWLSGRCTSHRDFHHFQFSDAIRSPRGR
jgi:hypothetical protein